MAKIEIQKNKGFVILFAMMISSIILMIALGVINIATKEIKFSSGAKDTNDAFFAADTGAECALEYDRSDNNAFTDSSSVPMNCAGSNVTLSATSPEWNFVVSGTSFIEKWCAKVKVKKTFDTSDPPAVLLTEITSKGYNSGGPTCDQTSGNNVERELYLSYGP